jgi:hypothetical protein
MNWATHHRNSEQYAAQAAEAVAAGDAEAFRTLFGLAAEEEVAAFAGLNHCRVKKRSLVATRAVLLWLNAGKRENAENFGQLVISQGGLTPAAANQVREMLADPKVLFADRYSFVLGATPGKPQVTTLTPNSNCSAVALNDANNAVSIQFMAPPNQIPWWLAMASEALLPVVNPYDEGNAVVTFKAGLTVSYRATGGGNYLVLMSGNIIDSGTTYPFTGAVIYSSTMSVLDNF